MIFDVLRPSSTIHYIIDQYVVDEKACHLFLIPISFLVSSTICVTQLCISVSHSVTSSSVYGKLSVS